MSIAGRVSIATVLLRILVVVVNARRQTGWLMRLTDIPTGRKPTEPLRTHPALHVCCAVTLADKMIQLSICDGYSDRLSIGASRMLYPLRPFALAFTPHTRHPRASHTPKLTQPNAALQSISPWPLYHVDQAQGTIKKAVYSQQFPLQR